MFNKNGAPVISLHNVVRTFRTSAVETRALDLARFEVEPGEFVAIMGPSGCGKSTLLNILGMLDRASAGEYTFAGTKVSMLSGRQIAALRKGNVGFVFQSFNLIDDLSVFENVELPLQYQGLPKASRRQKVDEALARLDIGHRAKHFPSQLSGGQQQRVAIARAIVAQPKVILADEPTGNLDSSNGAEVMKLLASLNRDGTTIVMVTHSRDDASFATRIVDLLDGKVTAPTDERSRAPATPALRAQG
jgi:putative ABC transport system ATP-binding protein